MLRSGLRCGAALAALTVLACAHQRRHAKRLPLDVDTVLSPSPAHGSSGGEDDKTPPPQESKPGAVVFDRAWAANPRMPHLRLGARDISERLPDRTAAEILPRPSSSTATAPSAGPRPDGGRPEGRPAARRPDEIVSLPTSGQPHYFSPAPLKKVKTDVRFPAPPAQTGQADFESAAPGASAERADFFPAPTADLSADVPETMVADPKGLGSYHVQVATSAAFGALVFDRIYPFMAEINLVSDLAAKGTKKGVYWVRYSIVDLLGFEQPFSPPQRFEFGVSASRRARR